MLDLKRNFLFESNYFFFREILILSINLEEIIYFFSERITRRILTLSLIITYMNIIIFSYFEKIIFLLRRLIIISSDLRIFILIRRFILRLLITWISRVNLIIISFSFDILSFIKKESLIYLLIEYLLVLISRRIIKTLYFFVL